MLGTKASAFLQGASDERAFVVQYDADNFESNTPNNDKVKLQVPPPRLDELRRDSGTPEVVPLTLRLKTPCTIWRPRLDALVSAAKPSAEAFFNELVQLSKATTVRIAVNRKWQTDEYKNLLTVINSASEGFSGYPVARYYSNFFDKGDWTIFGPVNPIKRPRAVSAPSSPPDYKRANSKQSPILDPIPSPIEVASSPSRSQIARLFSLFPLGDEDYDNFQSQAINRAVERHLHKRLPQLLPSVIEQHLPDLLALPEDFPSYNSDIDTPSPPNADVIPYSRDLTSLGQALMPFLLKHLQPQVQNMISNLLNRGLDSRKRQAALELDDLADGKVTDMHWQERRIMNEVARERDRLMDDLRHEGKDRVNTLRQQTDGSMDKLDAKQSRGLRRLRRKTTEGVAELEQRQDEGVDALDVHAEELLEKLRAEVVSVEDDFEARINDKADEIIETRVSARANAIVDALLHNRSTALVAATRSDLEELKDKMMSETKGMMKMEKMRKMSGEKFPRRGQRPGRRAGKGGYYAIGHRYFS